MFQESRPDLLETHVTNAWIRTKMMTLCCCVLQLPLLEEVGRVSRLTNVFGCGLDRLDVFVVVGETVK